jgi:hypothetical protein
MQPTRPLGPAIKAQVAAEINGLPHGRITEQGPEARVFTADLDELTQWWFALGGRITSEPAPKDSGVRLWTLHTNTDHGNGIPVRVHALALDTDQLDADCADAVA